MFKASRRVSLFIISMMSCPQDKISHFMSYAQDMRQK